MEKTKIIKVEFEFTPTYFIFNKNAKREISENSIVKKRGKK